MNIKTDKLHRALFNALLFAGTDETVGILRAVEITCDGKGLTLAATDRFTLGVARVTLDTGGGAWRFVLARSDAEILVKSLKTLKRDIAMRTAGIRCDEESIIFTLSTGEAFTFKTNSDDFPKWRKLFPANGSQVPTGVSTYTGEYLARFGRVLADTTYLRLIHFGDNKVRVVVIGEEFVGLIMPWSAKEYTTAPWTRPEWLN